MPNLHTHFLIGLGVVVTLAAQAPSPDLSPADFAARVTPSVALVLASHGAVGAANASAGAVIVQENGILLTAYHAIKNATAVQVRLKNGETYDNVVLLGVDTRRDIAAIKISATRLPVLPTAPVSDLSPGTPVTVVSHSANLPWSVSDGVVSAFRLADEIAGAGSGYRLMQFTAPISPGSSGGVVVDRRGRMAAIVIGSIAQGQNLNFAVPVESVLGLASVPPSSAFASGSDLSPRAQSTLPSDRATPDAPEKSDLLKASKDPDFLLRNFKTMYVRADRAQFFGSDQLKAQLGRNKGFSSLGIRVVDDPRIADVVLDVSYTFPADYPFELKHQNSATVLLAGKGIGPFSGIAGAASVASEFVKAAKPYRITTAKP